MTGTSEQNPVGGHYLVDVNAPLPDAGGGLPVFAATDRRGPGRGSAMAFRVTRHAPVRARALQTVFTGIEGMLLPLAHGLGPPLDGQDAFYVICQAPAGPPVSADPRPWPEAALLDRVLRPIAGLLEDLHNRGLTHRAIRPNNVFLAAANHPLTLGAAWAAPPAMHQPAVCETPATALCHPAARGDGQIADDVYALAVLLVTLALGHPPMEGMDDRAILHRKLEIGDFAAITGGERLPPLLTDIVRGMLAEDPDHRPSPTLLRDPGSVRGRRVAARPPPRAARPFRLGALPVWNNRTLALAMATEPAEAVAAIQTGTLTYWLRRGLGDAGLAVKLEELLRHHAQDAGSDREMANAMLIMRAVAAADVFMPLCWRGLALFPDGLGAALAIPAESDPDLPHALRTLIALEATALWAVIRDERGQVAQARLEARKWRAVTRIKGPSGGLPRLTYALNPLAPCASPLLAGRWIAMMSDLPPALDALAATSPAVEVLDAHVVAFIAARSERWLEQEVKALTLDAAHGNPASPILSMLRLLSEMQIRFHQAPLPGLAAWIAARAAPLTGLWKNRERRTVIEERLQALTRAGSLPPMLALLDNRAAQTADAEGLRGALSDLARLDAELHAITTGTDQRAALAARLGQEIAAGVGLAAIAATLVLAALG